MLLEFFRSQTGHEPASIRLRNIGLAYCGRPLRLNVQPLESGWSIWTEDDTGAVLLEGRVD
jgi:hydroxyacyl-ACP dehydratase HTD2-like protein with hotdog domain